MNYKLGSYRTSVPLVDRSVVLVVVSHLGRQLDLVIIVMGEVSLRSDSNEYRCSKGYLLRKRTVFTK